MKYHRDIYMPSAVENKARRGRILLKHSEHARMRAWRNGIRLPLVLDTCSADIVEIEVLERGKVKALYRVHMDREHDMVLAVMPRERLVKTVWVNKKSDEHVTLRKEEYVHA